MAYKTPGVYVQEIALLPPSVAEVATAIPAFIGYTQLITSVSGRDLTNVPVRISSLIEYQSIFGGAYQQKTYTVTVKGKQISNIEPDKRYMLYTSMMQYFDNGGGPCYIVSVGAYGDAIAFDDIKGGIDAVKAYDEPTLILFPDAVLLLNASNEPDKVNFGQLQNYALDVCAKLQDRFSIFDVLEGDKPKDPAASFDPIADFRDQTGINNLNYGAVYYPWIITSYGIDVDFRQLVFLDGNNANAVISPANYNTGFSVNDAEKTLVDDLAAKIADTDTVLGEVFSSQADKDSLRLNGIAEITGQLGAFAADAAKNLPAPNKPDTKLAAYMDLLASVATAFPKAENDISASSPLAKDIEKLKADTKLQQALVALIAIEKNTKVGNILTGRTASTHYTQFSAVSDWLGGESFGSVAKTNTAYNNASLVVNVASIINDLAGPVTTLLASLSALINAALFYESQAEQALFTGHSFFGGVSQAVTASMRTIPPSGAVAGVYAAVDAARGVWKAPANVSLNNVIGPAVKIDNIDQDDMNVTSTGKSVNAIRAFAGKGTLVWGARTLAGNDNEWRYVPVRRFFIMVEESVKNATYPFVFENNDANTWTKLRMMVQNFLTLQWRAGALQGAKPEDAFYVHVGLNETMTADDILNGLLIVEIGMAVVRPAEFIILRFSHKMQEN
ncbi:MAG: phage tail sheath C-terminal domain-containing protein [Mucilaginibacter sp.]